MKRVLSLLAAIALLLALPTACGKSYTSGLHHAVIHIRDYGDVTVELDADQAPITVDHFLKLAESDFYNGEVFHRMQPGFVLQGGASDTSTKEGASKTIKGEFLANGVNNTISHTRGVISMARKGNDMDSASNQFFIVLSDNNTADLDGLYAGFGHVSEGMDVIDRICEETEPYVLDSFGSLPTDMYITIESIEVID